MCWTLRTTSGIQEELSQPVVVLLNEEKQTLAFASQAGFRCFTGVDEFKRYVTVEILGESLARRHAFSPFLAATRITPPRGLAATQHK